MVINEFGALNARQRVKKDGSKGAIRHTVTIDATPTVLAFEAKTLGRGPALAIAAHLRSRVENIQVRASGATIALRAQAAQKKTTYTAGRYPKSAPNQSDRLFSDSGTLARGIVVGAIRGNAWIVNVPAARFNPNFLRGGEAALASIFARLVELVPEFGDGRKLREILSVRRAIKDATPLIDPRLARFVGRALEKRGRALKKSVANFLNQEIDVKYFVDGFTKIASV